MIAYCSRDADAARRAFGLESSRYIHGIPVKIGPISNRIANVDCDTKTDGPFSRLISVMGRNLLLHLHGTAHRPINAIEHDEKGIATSLNDSAAVLLYRQVYQVAAQSPQPLKSPCIVQPNQAAVANHVGIDDGDQLPPIWQFSVSV